MHRPTDGFHVSAHISIFEIPPILDIPPLPSSILVPPATDDASNASTSKGAI